MTTKTPGHILSESSSNPLQLKPGAVIVVKTPGQIAYEARREDCPNYVSGRPKPEWENLSATDRGYWECRAAHEAEARAREHAPDMLRTLREIAGAARLNERASNPRLNERTANHSHLGWMSDKFRDIAEKAEAAIAKVEK